MQMELSVKDRGERDESGGQGEFQDQREGELAPITSIELRVTTGMVDGSASDGDLAGQRGG